MKSEHSTQFWLGDKHLEVRFVVEGEYLPATRDYPAEYPDLNIIEVEETTESGKEAIDWEDSDFHFLSKIQDYCWMEWDVYRSEKNLLRQEKLNDPF